MDPAATMALVKQVKTNLEESREKTGVQIIVRYLGLLLVAVNVARAKEKIICQGHLLVLLLHEAVKCTTIFQFQNEPTLI